VLKMRKLIASQKGESDAWDLKLASGGLIDIEFLAQYEALLHANSNPEILNVSPTVILRNAAKLHLMSANDAGVLQHAYRTMSDVMQMSRLTVEGTFRPKQVAPGVLRRIASATGVPDFARLENELVDIRGEVRAMFNKLLR
jgi:glutamate-ammonia-ligase adenylyltransferase